MLCGHETSFRKDTHWALCYGFCHVRTLSLVFLSILNNFLACKLAFCMFLATIQIHESPMSSLSKVLGMQIASLCQSLSHNDRVRLGHSGQEMMDEAGPAMTRWPTQVDEGKAVHVVYLDLSWAFDVVSHSILLERLDSYGLDRCTHHWVNEWLNTWPRQWGWVVLHPAGDSSLVVFPRARFWSQSC